MTKPAATEAPKATEPKAKPDNAHLVAQLNETRRIQKEAELKLLAVVETNSHLAQQLAVLGQEVEPTNAPWYRSRGMFEFLGLAMACTAGYFLGAKLAGQPELPVA